MHDAACNPEVRTTGSVLHLPGMREPQRMRQKVEHMTSVLRMFD